MLHPQFLLNFPHLPQLLCHSTVGPAVCGARLRLPLRLPYLLVAVLVMIQCRRRVLLLLLLHLNLLLPRQRLSQSLVHLLLHLQQLLLHSAVGVALRATHVWRRAVAPRVKRGQELLSGDMPSDAGCRGF